MRHVLIVDDVPEILSLFRGLMRSVRSFDVRLTTENNAHRALELAQREPYDLVLTDFRMREADGIRILTAARQRNPAGRRVLMTGFNEVPTDLERVLEAEVDAYIQKPLRTQDVLLLVADMLQEREATLASCRSHARRLEETAMREQRPLGFA